MPKLSWKWLTFGVSWKELLCVWGAIALIVGLAHVQKVYGQELQMRDPAPHEHYHDFYKDWMQPAPNENLSCCNANVYTDETKMVHISGDCEPTDAKLVNGKWFARLPKYLGGEFIEVPDEKIIRQINPDPNRGHLCYAYGNVLCFVPPFGGM